MVIGAMILLTALQAPDRAPEGRERLAIMRAMDVVLGEYETASFSFPRRKAGTDYCVWATDKSRRGPMQPQVPYVVQFLPQPDGTATPSYVRMSREKAAKYCRESGYKQP